MFIDSHCHLDFPCFTNNRELLLQQLADLHITEVIIPATHRKTWMNIKQLCVQHKNLYYALGIHPHFLDSFQEGDLAVLSDMLKNKDKHCIALGEIGLDKNAPYDMQLQETVFIKQLKIAKKFKLPVILHIVKCQSKILEILKAEKFSYGGVYHAFSGSYEVAQEFIKLGFKLGVGGVITYPNASKTKRTMSLVPVESLLLETDAPDMPVYQQQQENNSPSNLLVIFEALLNCRSESKIGLATQIYKNTHSIFSLNND